jgi:hypothetical protein
VVAGGIGATLLSTSATTGPRVLLWPACALSLAAVASLYLCFAMLVGWWPARRLLSSETASAAPTLIAGERQEDAPGPPRRVWGDLPARNPGFTGREELLAAVRNALVSGGRAAVQALHGWGGVGKTQLAAEYAHRFRADYDVGWWIRAERTGLIGEQVAALGAELGCAAPGTSLERVRVAVLTELRERERWLLIFDNAESPQDIAGWLPGGNGHVLITSRAQGWEEVAVPVEVDVLDRAESVALLTGRVPGLADADADRVAEELGDCRWPWPRRRSSWPRPACPPGSTRT